MVRLVKYISIVWVVLIMPACPFDEPFNNDVSIRIVNNSEEDIFWIFNFERYGEWYEKSPVDFYSWLEKDKYDKYVILRGGVYIDEFSSTGAKQNFTKGWKKYYLFNYDSVKTIPWERICAERIILKEVTFNSWEDFVRCNFEITYP